MLFRIHGTWGFFILCYFLCIVLHLRTNCWTKWTIGRFNSWLFFHSVEQGNIQKNVIWVKKEFGAGSGGRSKWWLTNVHLSVWPLMMAEGPGRTVYAGINMSCNLVLPEEALRSAEFSFEKLQVQKVIHDWLGEICFRTQHSWELQILWNSFSTKTYNRRKNYASNVFVT